MKKYFPFLFLIGCAGTTAITVNPVKPVPEITVLDTIHKTTTIVDTVLQIMFVQDTLAIPISGIGEVDVRDFGAKWDGVTDDIVADSTACAYCIAHPVMCSTVRFPVGNTVHSRPLLLQNVVNGANQMFSINLKGGLSNKAYLNAYGSTIHYTGKSGFAIGVELGRSIKIENLSIVGQFGFPNSINNQNIGTTLYSAWKDSTISDTRGFPYCGISIDPYQLLQGGSGGSSQIEVSNCAIKQFIVGAAIGCNGVTLNAEMINFIDDNIDAVKDCFAIGQDQSKTIDIERLKVWASVHTILDGVNYGKGTGGGSVFCENWNIAGNCNELFNLNTDRFPLSAKDIYSESLFRIGNVGFGVGANFINTEIDFLSGPGLPEADYLIAGQANFYGGMLRYYDDDQSHRMNLNSLNCTFRDMTFNVKPITIGMYGYPSTSYPVPFFDNVHNYYIGGLVNNNHDSIYSIREYINIPVINIDRVNWLATISGTGIGKIAQGGDYVLGSPNNSGRKFWDQQLNPNSCNTIQIGRVYAASADTLYLNDVGVNVSNGQGYDNYFIDRLK